MVTATSGTGATVAKLFNGTTEVAKGTGGANWAVSSGIVTIKSAYLSTLTAGEHSLTLKFNRDNDCSVVITVIDTTPEPEG